MKEEAAMLEEVEAAAERYLRRVGGAGDNKKNLRALKDAVDRAVVSVDADLAPGKADVRPGERVEDDPIWRSGRALIREGE